jgi:hypothetical protein
MARSHSDIKGRRPFDVPAVVYPFGFDRHGTGPSREPLSDNFGFRYGFRNLNIFGSQLQFWELRWLW